MILDFDMLTAILPICVKENPFWSSSRGLKLIDDFLEVVTCIEKYNRTAEQRFVFIITCSTSPEVEEYAKKKEVEIIWSYEV